MERTNVAELLKDCPSGMELDCTIYEDVEFMEIDTESDTIILRVGNKFIRRLNKYGQDDNVDNSKCVIFPKGKTTWEGFKRPFKDGEVIVDESGAVALYKQVHSSYEEPYVDFHCGITSKYRRFLLKDGNSLQHCGKIGSIRLATEEEKAELFQAIKDNGYRWDAETLTLKKLLKFKVGDRIRPKYKKTSDMYTIHSIDEDSYCCGLKSIWIDNQDDYELVPDTDKFDITTLKPLESKVLVWDDALKKWIPAFWGNKCDGEGYITTYGWSKYCIPFGGNEHLTGTSKDCDKFYKTWIG